MKNIYIALAVLCLVYAPQVSAAGINTPKDSLKSDSVLSLGITYASTTEINQYDRVHVHAFGATADQSIAWVYSNNTQTVPPEQADMSLERDITFAANTFSPGTYEVRMYKGGTNTVIGGPKVIQIFASTSPDITTSLSKSTWHKNERIVVPYTYLDTAAFNFYDWAVVVPASASTIEGNIVLYKYMITDSITGPTTPDFQKYPYGRTVHIPPQALSPGSYKLYFLQAGTYTPYSHETLSFTVTNTETTSAPSGMFDVPISTTTTHEAFPTLIRMSANQLLYIYRDAMAHAYSSVGKIMSSTSLDGGLTWSAPRAIYDTPNADDVPGSGHVMLADGSILMSMFTRPTSETMVTQVLKSRDAGATWTSISTLPSSPGHVPYGKMFMAPGTTTIVMPGYGTTNGGGAMYTSTDSGLTWGFFDKVVANVVEGGPNLTYTEAAILPITSTHWLSVVRKDPTGTTTDNTLYMASSTDAGVTWSEPVYLFEGASPDLTLLPNGDVLLCVSDRQIYDTVITNPQVYNVSLPDPALLGSHSGVRCHLSYDDGETWSLGKLVFMDYTQHSSDHGYPYVALEGDRVYLPYYRENSTTTASVQTGFMMFSPTYFANLDTNDDQVVIAPSESRYLTSEPIRVAYKYPLQAPFNYYDNLEVRQGGTLQYWAYLNGTQAMTSPDFVPSIKDGMISIPAGTLAAGTYTLTFVQAGTSTANSPSVEVVVE